MMKKLKLTIELVPSTSWYNNVRSNVSSDKWDIIRKKCYGEAGNVCEICKKTGKEQGFNHAVECHEIWQYDDTLHTQTLTGLISLCPWCHKVKHTGLAIMNGEGELVQKQLMKVNHMSEDDMNEYVKDAFIEHRDRSKYEWIVDVSYVDEYLKSDLDKMCERFE
jgi:hypothetical protein